MVNSLNDGKVHGMDEVAQVGLEETAKNFSEGSEDLEKILLNLWEMGIDTFACCKGSRDKNHHSDVKCPYVSILITPENRKRVKTLMRYIQAQSKFDNPDMIVIKDDYRQKQRTSLLLQRICLTNNGCKNVLKNILSATEDMKQGKELAENDKNLEPVFEMMDEFIDRNMTGALMYDQVKVKCSHRKSTPVVSMKGRNKYNNILTVKTLDAVKKKWGYASYPVRECHDERKVTRVSKETIQETGYYDQTKNVPVCETRNKSSDGNQLASQTDGQEKEM